MKKIFTLIAFAFFACANLSKVKAQTKPIVQQEVKVKFTIDLGNIEYYSSEQIKSRINKLSADYISKITANNRVIVVKASSTSKALNTYKFEAEIKGTKSEIEKEISTLNEVMYDLAKSADH